MAQAEKPAMAASRAEKAKKPSPLKAVATSLTMRASLTSTARRRIAKPSTQATEGRNVPGATGLTAVAVAEVDGTAEAAVAAAAPVGAAEAVVAAIAAAIGKPAASK